MTWQPPGHQPAQPITPQPPMDGVWPPQPTAWPPPPSNAPAMPHFHPFTFVYKRLDGNIADFREGAIGLSADGITIQGRVQPRAEIQTPILIVSCLLSILIAIVASVLMRYAFLKPDQVQIPWQNVLNITLVPGRNWACIVYNAPNYNGTVKKFCLAMGMQPAIYASFAELANIYAPGLSKPGKLRPGTLMVLLVLLGILGVVILVIMVFAAFSSRS